MPRIPLALHRQQAQADNPDGNREAVDALREAAAGLVNNIGIMATQTVEEENEDTQALLAAAPAVATNVGIMARRIGDAQRKKRRAYRPPPERPLGGDVESSDSDENEESDDSDESNDDDDDNANDERPLLR